MRLRNLVERGLQLLISIHVAVPAGLHGQRLVAAALGNMPMLQYQNFTGLGERRQAVGADNDRPPLPPLAQVMQDLVLGAAIHRR